MKKAKNKVKRLVKGKVKFKLQPVPLSEQQIQEFVVYYNERKSFPGSKIPCNVTGKLTTCIGPWMAKKIKEFGSAEKLLRNYKCRGAVKTQKLVNKPVRKSKRKIKILELKDEQKNWDIPKMNLTPPSPATDTELKEITKTACLRPDIFLDNERFCDGCEFYSVCTNAMKCLLGWTKSKRKAKTK